MNDLREELIQAITEVSRETNITVNECIEEAIKILKEEQKKYKDNTKVELIK